MDSVARASNGVATPATLTVLQPGACTLVVDPGRPRTRSLGVPLGGAADRFALALGNGLVGNPPDTAALEVCLTGPTLQADAPLACVLQGASFSLTTDQRQLRPGTTFTLRPGEILRIGTAVHGLRAYFCVRGGLMAPLVLGSRSSLEPLSAGAVIPFLPGTIHGRFLRLAPVGDPYLRQLAGAGDAVACLRVLDGPQGKWFPPEDLYGEPSEPHHFVISPASNRMGLRLQGPPVHLPDRELVSEPVGPGTVQVTGDGQVIILGVDGQTIGGYPKIAQVISADLDLIGQLRPGDRVLFERVTMGKAEELYRCKQRLLREWVTRFRVAEMFAVPGLALLKKYGGS